MTAEAKSCLTFMGPEEREQKLRENGCVDWLAETYVEQGDWRKAAGFLQEHQKWAKASEYLAKVAPHPVLFRDFWLLTQRLVPTGWTRHGIRRSL
eukprot:3935494-Rhodomonas_salina.2